MSLEKKTVARLELFFNRDLEWLRGVSEMHPNKAIGKMIRKKLENMLDLFIEAGKRALVAEGEKDTRRFILVWPGGETHHDTYYAASNPDEGFSVTNMKANAAELSLDEILEFFEKNSSHTIVNPDTDVTPVIREVG